MDLTNYIMNKEANILSSSLAGAKRLFSGGTRMARSAGKQIYAGGIDNVGKNMGNIFDRGTSRVKNFVGDVSGRNFQAGKDNIVGTLAKKRTGRHRPDVYGPLPNPASIDPKAMFTKEESLANLSNLRSLKKQRDSARQLAGGGALIGAGGLATYGAGKAMFGGNNAPSNYPYPPTGQY